MIKHYRLINKEFSSGLLFEPFEGCENIGDIIKIDTTKEYQFPINDIHGVLISYDQNSYFFLKFFEDVTAEVRNKKLKKILK